MANRAACQAVLDWLLAFPEQHDQSDWLCGTKMCVGGVAVYLSGELNIDNDDNVTLLGHPVEEWHTIQCPPNERGHTYLQVSPVANEHNVVDHRDYIARRAAELLQLAPEEANHLFFNVTEGEALDMLKALANGDQETVEQMINNCEEC